MNYPDWVLEDDKLVYDSGHGVRVTIENWLKKDPEHSHVEHHAGFHAAVWGDLGPEDGWDILEDFKHFEFHEAFLWANDQMKKVEGR